MSLGENYLMIVKKRFQGVKELGDKTISRLSKEELNWAYNEESNSTAVIIRHMSGNMVSRWTDFLTSDGEKPYRNRDEEFSTAIASNEELITIWEKGWKVLFSALDSLKEQDLLRNITIRGESHLVMDAIERQMAHYSSHVGQIVYIGKQIKNGEWESLSIPRGQSDEYLKEMLTKHNAKK
ncbi:hypothetical protein AF332_13565 [Sporosarcina globispora]|uniref:DUF1572 domain-containing protein n=1 Tax=Sporosarcina globispora TaxID=1459 RepID=A0A0M0GCW6_SPOGL|nr:DUF1572 family protein [Sporosarcina globispora]KON87755.1 hypothetical protein AF332_13565 [Sporosarcina globispora]